jgi:hypothetical protein
MAENPGVGPVPPINLNPDQPLFGNSTVPAVAGVTGFFGKTNILLNNPVAGDQPPIRAGVYGFGNENGVQGESRIQNGSGVWGNNSGGGYGITGTSDKPNGIGVYGRGANLAAKFDGIVEVVGDIRLVDAADCAEDFDIAGLDKVEPGTVMVIESEGALIPSTKAYDKRVAGVISGAGKYKPGIVLDKQQSSNYRMPIALMGKVYCKVDAQYGSIEVGDLLTTSPTSGHAMRTDDPMKAFGAVIGKALLPLESGQGLIPILISLQ